MSLQRVLIHFEAPMASAGAHPAPTFFTSDIAIACPLRSPGEGFRLHGRGKPAWDLPSVPNPEWRAPLASEEAERLLALLGEMAIPYVPPRLSGMDGSWHILEIASGAHAVRFEWWMDPPPGWESAKSVYDYALLLARRSYLESLLAARP